MPNSNPPPMSGGMQYQLKIYFEGAQKKKPQLPVAFEELEAKAMQEMAPEAFAYIAGGAGGETTMHNNKEAFNRWRILPRMMGDVSARTTEVELFGTKLPHPVLLG
ncbi:MAG TPA: alpha-hydroxy-acid oxidizing protein, partial [Ginsengibacter sp.]|nr:alpha-hydroxy-acid oxidizing protein [Ginsengibacter sp.]